MDEKDCSFILIGDCDFFAGSLLGQHFRDNQRGFFNKQLRYNAEFAGFRFFIFLDLRQHHDGRCRRNGAHRHGG